MEERTDRLNPIIRKIEFTLLAVFLDIAQLLSAMLAILHHSTKPN